MFCILLLLFILMENRADLAAATTDDDATNTTRFHPQAHVRHKRYYDADLQIDWPESYDYDDLSLESRADHDENRSDTESEANHHVGNQVFFCTALPAPNALPLSPNANDNREDQAQIPVVVTVDVELYYDGRFEARLGKGREARREAINYATSLMYHTQLAFRQPEIWSQVQIKLAVVEFGSIGDKCEQGKTEEYADQAMLFDCFKSLSKGYVEGKAASIAVLLTGYHIFSRRVIFGIEVNNPDALGIAQVEGACTDTRHAIVEGRSFVAGLVMVHEIGHLLGAGHDGRPGISDECNPSNFFMSPYAGPGKTRWSPCAVRDIRRFVTRKMDENRKNMKSCLIRFWKPPHSRVRFPGGADRLPGQVYDATRQCQLAAANPAVERAARTYHPFNDPCNQIWCEREWIELQIHQGLIGTECEQRGGPGHVCFAGKCQDPSVIPVLGQESDSPRPGVV